jgi:hypothetical protein
VLVEILEQALGKRFNMDMYYFDAILDSISGLQLTRRISYEARVFACLFMIFFIGIFQFKSRILVAQFMSRNLVIQLYFILSMIVSSIGRHVIL